MTREETMTTTDDKQKEKIKTPFAKVIVDGRGANSYFSILYFDPTDKDFHIGYSSYYLDYVFNWLNENFEIVEDGNFALSALRPVSREQVKKAEWIWSTGDVYICSSCGEKTHVDECMGTPIYNFCPFCMDPMTDEAVEMVMERLEEMRNG